MEEREQHSETRVPEYYASVVRLTTNINGTSILFGRTAPVGVEGDDTTTDPVCLVQMSPVQAKSLFLLLRQHLRDYEESWARIPVHEALAEQFGEDV